MAQGVPYNVFSGPGTISHANCIQFPHLAVADLRFTPRSACILDSLDLLILGGNGQRSFLGSKMRWCGTHKAASPW